MTDDESKIAKKNRSVAIILASMMAGPVIWGLYFVIVYGAHTLVCTIGALENAKLTKVGLVAAAGVALVGLAVVADAAPRWRRDAVESGGESAESAAFELQATRLLLLLSATAIIWTAMTPLFTAPCALLR